MDIIFPPPAERMALALSITEISSLGSALLWGELKAKSVSDLDSKKISPFLYR